LLDRFCGAFKAAQFFEGWLNLLCGVMGPNIFFVGGWKASLSLWAIRSQHFILKIMLPQLFWRGELEQNI